MTIEALVVNETRALKIDARKIDAKFLVEGEAPKVEVICRARPGRSRYYTAELPATDGEPRFIRVQCNEGDPINDEALLAEIVEDVLSPEELKRA